MKKVVVVGGFDNIRSREVRFLEEASKLGQVHVFLWSDESVNILTGIRPAFPQAERQYLVNAIRYVNQVNLVNVGRHPDELPQVPGCEPGLWAVTEDDDTLLKRKYCAVRGIDYTVIEERGLHQFPVHSAAEIHFSQAKKVVVTGCYDWFHSGHVRFFEETSEYGDLYVVIGSDRNVALLKGDGHPMFPENERRYMVASIRYVRQALISSGSGWMDAEPEIGFIRPEIYAVNKDGDKPEKRAFCKQHGLEYLVLNRTPAAGLPRRESTHLRGF